MPWWVRRQDNKWARLLAYVSGLVNPRLLLQSESLVAENRILRSHVSGRLRSDPERSALAEIGKRLSVSIWRRLHVLPYQILSWLGIVSDCTQVRRMQASFLSGTPAHRFYSRSPHPPHGPGELRLGIRSDRRRTVQPRPQGLRPDDRKHPEAARPLSAARTRPGRTSFRRTWPSWQCCNFQAAAHERRDAGVVSDCNLEQPGDEMELADNLTDAHPPGFPLPNRMHRFVTLDRPLCSPERADAFAGSHPPLDGHMTLLVWSKYLYCLNPIMVAG